MFSFFSGNEKSKQGWKKVGAAKRHDKSFLKRIKFISASACTHLDRFWQILNFVILKTQ